MAWLKKAKIEPKIEKKKEVKRQEEEDVEESTDLPEELGEEPVSDSDEPELVSKRDEPRQVQQQQQQSQVPSELQPDSAKFYQQEPVVQKVMFLPLQPEMHELISLTKQQAQIQVAIGNMLSGLVEGQKQLLASQDGTNKLLGQLIKEIELASQSNTN